MARADAPTRILRRMKGRGGGVVWTPSDFLRLGTRGAVDVALHRLARRGQIRRLAHGLYDLPSRNPRFGPSPPDMDQVVTAIARRTASRVQLSGEGALLRLGLSTQVPAAATYRTDGPSRRLVVMGRPIVLRHVAARRLVAPGTIVGTVVEALRTLGVGRVDEQVVARIRRALDVTDLVRLRRVARALPAWQRDVVDRIVGES